jgi:hypothetical protein
MTTPRNPQGGLCWPERWPATHGLRRFIAPTYSAIWCVIFLVGGLWVLSLGEWMGVLLLALAFALSSLVATAFLERIVSLRRNFRAVELMTLAARPAVFMAWPRVDVYARQTLNVTFFLVLALLPFLMEIIPDDESREYARISAISFFAPLFAVGMGAYIVAGFVRRGRLGIGLSPAGVYHRSWFGTCFYPWESIQGIQPVRRPRLAVLMSVRESARRNPNPEETPIGGFGAFRRSMTRIQAGALAVNPALAYHALGFYLAHPDLRGELGTESGVERIRAAEFTLSVDTRTAKSVDDR